jgi:proteic killer suppression protein
MISNVRLTSGAEKDLLKLPRHIVVNFRNWVRSVRLEGLDNVRLIKGYHDEALKGKRAGQRSVRLSRSYRAIYSIQKEEIELVVVEEVNKHDY